VNGKVNGPLLVAQIGGLLAVFGVVLFGAAGTIAWWPGWTFLVLFGGFTILLSAWLIRHNPDLLTERMTGIGKESQKTWDKVFFGGLMVVFLTWLALMPLDAVRFGWSHVPLVAQAVGIVLEIFAFWLFFLVYRANAYLSPAVRIQEDRGQEVVSTGPYAVVRHPMYATALLWLTGTTLLLGSWLGLLAGLALALAIAYRAVREEQVLRDELPGYNQYMEQVRYRLVPGVW
jgi:protein-S-isoprenylcysteine O-methyltransferase Ste14